MEEVAYASYDPQTHPQPPPSPLRMPDGLAPAQAARPAAPPPLPPRRPIAHAIDPIAGDGESVPPALIEMARAVSRITATRSLAFISVVTASVIWAYTCYDPTQLRIIASGVYSAVCVWPLVLLYWKKG